MIHFEVYFYLKFPGKTLPKLLLWLHLIHAVSLLLQNNAAAPAGTLWQKIHTSN